LAAARKNRHLSGDSSGTASRTDVGPRVSIATVQFEAVIGLEIHAQLLTRTKIFCGCGTAFGAPPNTLVCPVCLGFPGSLPVLNARAVELAVKAALALGCEIQPTSIFARKNYFYPDLPKGYQISQYERPFALAGRVSWDADGERESVRITRVHMEEDAGKSIHDSPEAATATCLDFNRAGVPLVEIVTEPDLRSGAAAAGFFSRLRDVLTTVGANDGNLEEGSLRCDANVSVRPAGTAALGTKVEIKNLNSFRYVQKAIEYEIARQSAVVREGGKIVQETRLFDADTGTTASMRSKEEAHDYRYFPEPDLPPLRIDAADLARWQAELPELPDAKRERLVAQYGLPAYDAGVLTQSAALAAFFEQTAAAAGNAKAASNWIMGELLRVLRAADTDIAALTTVTPESLGALIRLVDAGTINGPTAKSVFETMVASGRAPGEIVQSEGLAQVSDESAVLAIVREVIARESDAVAQYRKGKQAAIGFLTGQVMKAAKGKANPKLAGSLLARELGPPGAP
jgi:aspartyl-tRNA(Asn)/glutamyl-tRNA(Gln) amidotransferase subunit B